MFEQGEQVVCINGKVHPEIGFMYLGGFVEEGKTYTVRDCELGRGNWNTKTKGWESATWKVLVAEITNPIDPSTLKGAPSELGFSASRFRTLDQLEQEERLSVAKHEPILKPVGELSQARRYPHPRKPQKRATGQGNGQGVATKRACKVRKPCAIIAKAPLHKPSSSFTTLAIGGEGRSLQKGGEERETPLKGFPFPPFCNAPPPLPS